ncbi:MAG: hypothetical protein PVI01_19725, partial [Gemmatimonadales bacterium]
LVSHRPYQKQYSPRDALEVLKHRSGTLFDPSVVDAFVEAASRHLDRFEQIVPRNRSAPLVQLDSIGFSDETSN